MSTPEKERKPDRFGRRMTAGEALFSAGEPADRAFLIQQGAVRLAKKVRDREQELVLLKPGELFGEEVLLYAPFRTCSAVAHTDGEVLCLDRTTLHALITTNSEVALRVVELLARRVSLLEHQLENAMLADDTIRVVSALLRAGPELRDGALVALTPADLAARSTATVGSVRDVAETLAAKGYIKLNENGVSIDDPTGLEGLFGLLQRREEVRVGIP